MGKWELVRLGDIGTIVTGSTPPKKEAIFYDSDDIPFFKPNDFSEDTIEKLTIPNEYVSEKARKKIRLLPVGSVLVTCIGTIGKVGIATCESTCNQQINAIIPHDKVITSEYLANVVLTRRAYLKQIANAPVVPIINKSNFSEVLIPLPPLDEQKRIAKNLDLASEIVKGYKEQLVELDKLVQSVFYKMFGDPVTNEKGWEVKKLREIYRVGSSKRIYQSEQEATGVPFLRISDLVKRINTGQSDADIYISPAHYETLKSKSLVPEPNDILVTSRGTLGLCYIVKKSDKFYFQDGMISWLHKRNLDVQSIYIATLFSNTIFRRNFDKIQTGTTVPYLSIAQLSEFNIIFPSFILQTSFASIVTEIEAQKAQIQQALTEAENLFNSLMQEYFE